MNKITALVLLLLFVMTSCKNSEQEVDQLELAKKFYAALDDSNSIETAELITETFTTIDDGFEQSYNRIQYAEWVKWDSVFQPTYEILRIEEENGIVEAKISKTDSRISFLHHEPIIMDEIIHYKNHKITSIDRVSNSFNVERFIKNRDELVNWIAENHPELNGFLNDQTKAGALAYLKAIELYRTAK